MRALATWITSQYSTKPPVLSTWTTSTAEPKWTMRRTKAQLRSCNKAATSSQRNKTPLYNSSKRAELPGQTISLPLGRTNRNLDSTPEWDSTTKASNKKITTQNKPKKPGSYKKWRNKRHSPSNPSLSPRTPNTSRSTDTINQRNTLFTTARLSKKNITEWDKNTKHSRRTSLTSCLR